MSIAEIVVGLGAGLLGAGSMTLGEVRRSVGDFFSGTATSGTEVAGLTGTQGFDQGAMSTFTQAAGAQPGIGEFPPTRVAPNTASEFKCSAVHPCEDSYLPSIVKSWPAVKGPT
jgi:hypothetical protein